MSAGILLCSRTDNFGVWGYNLYKTSDLTISVRGS